MAWLFELKAPWLVSRAFDPEAEVPASVMYFMGKFAELSGILLI